MWFVVRLDHHVLMLELFVLVHTKARVRRWTVVRVLPTASVLRWGAVVRISTNHDSQQRMRGQFIFQRKRHKKMK